MTGPLIIIFVCLALSAFFSGMEIAFVSTSKLQFSIFKNSGRLSSKLIARLAEKPGKFIATILVGNNIVLVVYSYYMGGLIVSLLFPHYLSAGELPFWLLLVQTLISTVIILLTGEFIPKTIFKLYSVNLLSFFALPAYLLHKLITFTGISLAMHWVSNFFIVKVMGKTPENGSGFNFARAELGYYIDERIEKLDEKEKEELDSEVQIFKNALEFSDVKARECMIPRTEIRALDINDSLEELNKMFIETGLSKIVIYRETVDNIIGYVHSFELFRNPQSIKDVLLPVDFVPETIAIKDVLALLTKKRRSIAIVMDEYGGVAGMLTVEDIVEEILGDIEDEHDSENLCEQRISENEYLFAARLEVDYLNEEYMLHLPEAEEYETLGGLILSKTESIPQNGEVIELENGIKLSIEEAGFTKIETVKLTLPSQNSK